MVNFFMNDNFKLLLYLYDMKSSNGVVCITQQEISEETGFCAATVNKIIKQLRELGYIEQKNSRNSRYVLTNKTETLIQTIQSLEKECEK